MGQALLLEWFNSPCEGVLIVLFLKCEQWVHLWSMELLCSPGAGLGHPLSSTGFVPAALLRQRETFPLAFFKFWDALECCLQWELHITWKGEEHVVWQCTHPAQLLKCFWGEEVNCLQSLCLGAVSFLLLWFLSCWQLVMVSSLRQHRAPSWAKIPLLLPW